MTLIAEAPALTHRPAGVLLPHLPVLRLGRSYASLDKTNVVNHRTGEVIAQVSTVNAGIIRKDLSRIEESRAALKKFTVAQLMEISAKAGELQHLMIPDSSVPNGITASGRRMD